MNSLVHELRVMAAAELHVNATYYAQHPALKSVYEKSQPVIGGKLFSSYRTVFELVRGLRDTKTNGLNCSYEALVQKEAMTISQERMFASFLCVLSLSSAISSYSCINLIMVCTNTKRCLTS